MSSSMDGAAVIAGGVVALGAGAALGAVVGTGWLLYQSGKLITSAVRSSAQAVEEKVARERLEAQLRHERAEMSHKQIRQMYKDFIEEAQAELSQIKSPEIASQLQILISRIHMEQESASNSTERLEARNAAALSALDMAMREKTALLEKAQIPETSMGHYALGQYIADLQGDLEKAKSMGVTVGENAVALSPEQYARMRLRVRYEKAALSVRQALENEDRRAVTYPVSAKLNKRLHLIFDGMAQRIAKLNDPTVSNSELKMGISNLEACLEHYRHVSQVLDEEEAEFTALYAVYRDVQDALETPVMQPHEFSDLAHLKVAMEACRQQVERAQYCARLYSSLDVDAYLCLAFDTEMRALGYSVMDSRQLTSRISKTLQEHTCANGITIPAFDIPNEDALTQLYNIDEHCDLQLIVHEDGTTTLQTLMHGNDTEQTVESQQKHCDRASELSERLRKNWFVKCDLTEIAPAQQVQKTAMGIQGDSGIRRVERKDQRNTRYQKQ